jgi:hypothetical protein
MGAMVSNNRDARNNQRARLMSGVSSVALSVASMVVALGICAPGDVQAQTTVNTDQSTPFTLAPAGNPYTFNATIDTSGTPNTSAVSGAPGTAWDVTNLGTLRGDLRGVSLDGAGSSLTNSGIISETGNLQGSAAVVFGAGGTVINHGTITGLNSGIEIDNASGTVTNDGTITSTAATGVYLKDNGNVTNQQTGKITGFAFGILTAGLPGGTIINAGSMTATAAASTGIAAIGVSGPVSSLTNQTGGTISGRTIGVEILNATTVTNEQGATISGGVGISMDGTLTNAGTITGVTKGVSFVGGGREVASPIAVPFRKRPTIRA